MVPSVPCSQPGRRGRARDGRLFRGTVGSFGRGDADRVGMVARATGTVTCPTVAGGGTGAAVPAPWGAGAAGRVPLDRPTAAGATGAAAAGRWGDGAGPRPFGSGGGSTSGRDAAANGDDAASHAGDG